MIQPYLGAADWIESRSQLLPNGTVCEDDADFEVFDGVNTANILANIPITDV